MNHCIRKITTGGSVTTFAGTGAAGFMDGAANVARFRHPYDIVFDPINEFFYVADRDNHCIRKISMMGNVTTVAGVPGAPGFVNAPGLSARFVQPTGVAVTGELEQIYVADAGNHCIRKIDNLSIVTTFAGSVSAGNIDGSPTSAKFNSPLDVAWDTAGYLIVTDIVNHNIRRISENGAVTTIGGTGAPGYFDGPGCVVSQNNERFICDAMNHRLRKIEPGGEVITLAGDGNSGALNGPGMQSRFNRPGGIVRDSNGNLFISDTGNHAIRKVIIE
jgi:DNA-binding beta-propeller fold protein YncE